MNTNSAIYHDRNPVAILSFIHIVSCDKNGNATVRHFKRYTVYSGKIAKCTRMQEIADKAGINKSMLHYYYRSKDKLFEKVYQLSLMRALPQIVQKLNEDRPLEEKLRLFITELLKVISSKPYCCRK